MTEGTRSYLFGCHQFLIHPLLVAIAWKKIYKTSPRLWELVCIFLHDIGHIGKDFFSDHEQKKKHWILGAEIAYYLFDLKGYLLVGGHDINSGMERSQLFWADKYSWLIAPRWWLKTNVVVEKFDHSIDHFLKEARKNWENGCPTDTHQIYLDYKKGEESNVREDREVGEWMSCSEGSDRRGGV